MKKFCLILSALLLFTAAGSAQQTVTSYKASNVKRFNKPFMLDSVSISQKAFSVSEYLHAPSVPKDRSVLKDVSTFDGVYSLPQNDKEYLLQTLYLFVSNEGYKQQSITIHTNAMCKVSIDGVKEKEKMTSENDLDSAASITIQKTLEPGNHVIGIALLCSDNSIQYKIRTELGDSTSDATPDAQQMTGLTLKTMLCGENPYKVSMSNDGSLVLINYYDTDTKGKSTYRVEVRNHSDQSVVFKDDKTTSYAWLPKSNILYYKEKGSLYTLNPLNGERKLLLSDVKDGNITFLPNEREFILSVTTKKDNTKDDIHRMYLPDDRIPGWRDRTALFLCDIEGNVQPLAYSYRSTYLNDISPDGKKILFSVRKDSLTARPFTFNSIYQLDLNSFKVDTLVLDDGFVSSAQYLQDGNNIVLSAGNEAFNSIGSTLKKGVIPNIFNNSIYLMNLRSKQIKAVGKTFNPSINDVIVRKDNLYLKCTNKDSISVFRYDLLHGTYSLVDLNVDIVGAFDISEDETKAAYYGENYNKPKRVFFASSDKNNDYKTQTKEVYFPKEESFKQTAIGKCENYSFKMHGSQIDGRLYYPKDFDAAKKYPMIVYYYGGCEPTDRSFEMRYSAWLYTQQGYVVYVINPSGTIGWGQDFAARHVNAWGDWTADEIIEGVKRLCREKTFINDKKIGCMGASYGGFMTQYLQTKTDIFACAISHAGISNITSYWGEGYWGYSYSAAASADSYPWNNPDLYTKHSPLFNADKIKTPLLLLHGTADTNVPIGESIQMYNALKILGKEVEFITVKGENHGIVDFEKRLKWNNTIYAWFAKWLKDDSSWWDELYPKENF